MVAYGPADGKAHLLFRLPAAGKADENAPGKRGAVQAPTCAKVFSHAGRPRITAQNIFPHGAGLMADTLAALSIL